MGTDYSVDELLEFLGHAADRGLMPAATAQALAVASRRVFELLNDGERADVRRLDIEDVAKRFRNKRAKDFNPSSLTEYGRRAQRAVNLFTQWRDDPGAFSVKTRSTGASRQKNKTTPGPPVFDTGITGESQGAMPNTSGGMGYQTSFPVRPGTVVTITNIPADLSKAEAERLAQFVKMLSVG